MEQFALAAKTSVSPRSSPLGTFRAKRPQRRRARTNGCFRRLSLPTQVRLSSHTNDFKVSCKIVDFVERDL